MKSLLPAAPAAVPARPAGPRPRRGTLVLALGLALAAGACKDDPVRATDDVVGTWLAVDEDGGPRTFIRIAEDDIEVFSEDLIADCFDRALYEILEIDGDAFRITDQVDTFSVELRRDGEELVVAAFGESLNYAPTTIDPATLTVCSGPNPGVTCDQLPILPMDVEVDASLTSDDPENEDGSHFDLYRIQVDAPSDLLLEMSSAEIDSYLILFQADGVLVAQNDDASALTLNARIAPALEPGCYIAMATSAGPVDFGDYTIELTTP